MQRHSNVTILGTRVDMVQIPDALRLIQECIEKKSHGNYIVVTNANEVVAGKKRPEVRDAANNSRLSVPDGFSLILLARFYGYRLKKRAYGPDLMLAALKLAEQRSYSNFFYGSTQNTLDLLGKSLKGKFPAANPKKWCQFGAGSVVTMKTVGTNGEFGDVIKTPISPNKRSRF